MRKITSSLAKIKLGLIDSFELGNFDARRDWGYAGDYVEAMWRMLQAEVPKDYIIASGKTHTVRELVQIAAAALDMRLRFEGEGQGEVGTDENGRVLVSISPEFYRPAECVPLCGDGTGIERDLGWGPTTSFERLVAMMAQEDLKSAGGGRKT